MKVDGARRSSDVSDVDRFCVAERRRKRIIAHYAKDYQDAEDWDLRFWQNRTPQERLSALVALRRDLAAIHGARRDLDGDDS